MKQDIRKLMIELRKKIDVSSKIVYQETIINKIKNDINYQHAKSVAIYMPLAYEIDLRSLCNDDKIFLIPRVDGKHMVFVKYYKDMKYIPSSFGVNEPSKDEIIYDKKIDFMITPALAISKTLDRIGYGKGYYDQYLSLNRPHHVMGVIYPFQEIEAFEVSSNDQKIDGYYIGDL